MCLFPQLQLVTVELQQCSAACENGTVHQDSTAHSLCACSPTTDWSLWNYNSVAQHVRMEQCIWTAQHVVYVLVPPPLTGHCGIRTIWCKNNQVNQESIVHQDIIQMSAPLHPNH